MWSLALRLLLVAVTAVALFSQEKPDPKADAKPAGLPIKPERKIEFTTDEGTWISLDVSADGNTIVFELLGDLYTIPMTGGEAKPLMSGMPFDSQPKFSPDGKRIAFLSDRDGGENLWIANADGSSPKKLTKDKDVLFASPSWTPDGQYVVVSRQNAAAGLGLYELWMYHIQGGSGIQITKGLPTPNAPREQRPNVIGVIASPDGKYFYYARKTGGFGYNLTLPGWQIVRRDRTSGDEDTLTQAQGSAFRPVLSPDGKWLVYGSRSDAKTGLRIRNLETGEDRWLKYPVQRDDQESRFTRDILPGYAFTPDGKEIVASYGGKIYRVAVATGKETAVPFTAKVTLDLGPSLNFPVRVEDGPVKVRLAQDAVQSSDGKQIAFTSAGRVFVMATGGKPRRLTSGNAHEYQPAWSPDSQWVAYVTWSKDGGQIWKARADGSGSPQQLTAASAFYRDPSWNRDGTRIVALRSPKQARLEPETDFGPAAGLDVIWLPAAGGEPKLVAPARGVGHPHVGPDPERIYVHSAQGLISFRYDGTDRKTHMKVVSKNPRGGPEPVPADEVQISPDGQWVMAHAATQLYLIPLSQVGTPEPPSVNVSTPTLPVQRLTKSGSDSFAWADGGKTVTWTVGSTFFRQPLAAISFDKEKAGSPGAEKFEVALEIPRRQPQGTIVLRGGKAVTMKGDEVIPNADIVITGNRIVAVGRRGSVTIPAGARIQDVTGQTILPGFVDTHAHWRVRRKVHDLDNWSFLANLAYGVTSGRDPQTGTNDMFAYQDMLDAGEMVGLRAFSTGPGVFSNTDLQSYEEALDVVKRYQRDYRTHTLKSYDVGNRQQRMWMVQACKELGMMPTTEGALDMKLNITHAIDGFSGNEHAMPIIPLYKDVVELYARSGIFYTPTLLVAYGGPWAENYFYETTKVYEDPKMRRFMPLAVLESKTKRRPWFADSEHVYSRLAEGAAKIVRAGGRVGVGSHGQLQGIGYHWELWALQSGGMTNMETLRCATRYGAEAIGYAQDLGSIEPGKLADIVIFSKDPLDNIRNSTSIKYVMKNGELYDGDTLNQAWPTAKPLPEMWWWKESAQIEQAQAR